MDDDELIKVIVIGATLVGKTSFIYRYVNNSFRADYKSTIGVDFALKVVQLDRNKTVKLQLWDIAGQERFTFMTRAYYKDAKACILMFDLTNAQTFEKVKSWKDDLDSKARLPDGSLIPCLLVANKTDLPDRQVTQPEIADLCEQYNFVGWTETSVKDGTMVKESVSSLLDIVRGKAKKVPSPIANGMLESISLHKQHGLKKPKSSCQC